MTDEFLFARFVDDPDKLMELLAAYKERRDAEPGITFNTDAGFLSVDQVEPEPSEAATPSEPEPSAATTRSHTGLFWFVTDPKLKGATT
jgi:hypothetical protein